MNNRHGWVHDKTRSRISALVMPLDIQHLPRHNELLWELLWDLLKSSNINDVTTLLFNLLFELPWTSKDSYK